MTESEFWNGGMDRFYRHIIHYQNKQKKHHEEFYKDLDYLAWRTGESVKSALENVAILSLMIDGKDAITELKKRKYQEAPAYILIERQKNKDNKNSKLSKEDRERIRANLVSEEEQIKHNKDMQALRDSKPKK